MNDTTMTTVSAAVNKPPIVILRERLENRREELKNALTDITPDQFIRALMTSAQINPELQACTWQSIWEACMRSCRDGLLPDGVEAAIVPYKSRAQYIPMYQGRLRQFRRSGQFKSITANVVREGEEFSHYIDEQGPHFRHVPGNSFEAPIVNVYAMALTKEGGIFLDVMTIAEANKHRNMSRASRDDAPWKQWPEEMYKKTALLRLSKVLPSARDIIGDEDVPEIEGPATAPIAQVARAPGAASALEQFASSASAASLHTQDVQPPTEEDDGAQGPGRDTPSLDPAAADKSKGKPDVR